MDWFHLVELAITALVPSVLSYLIAIRDKEIKNYNGLVSFG
nr:MAG TPA: hypothetical protein [Caudoviricetes sp.]